MEKTMELCIYNANIIDGTGKPAFRGSVGLSRGRIALVRAGQGLPPPAREMLDAKGLTLCPGFIDAHSHGDLMLESDFSSLSKLSQGITTQVAGQCGVSMCPGDPERLDEFTRFVSGIAPYPTLPKTPAAIAGFDAYARYIEGLELPLNLALFTGHGALRLWAMGYDDSSPTASQQERMEGMLRECIQAGSLGLSTGLVYAPGCYGGEEEITGLLKAARAEGGIYATHVRDESDGLIEAEQEAVRSAEKADIPLFISHFKAAGRQNWGKPGRILKEVFDPAIARGLRLTVDHYPYLAGMTSLNVSVPPRFRKDGLAMLVRHLSDPAALKEMRAEMAEPNGYDNYIYNSGGFGGVLVSSCPLFRGAEGMTIAAYAEKTGQDPFDAYTDILRRNQGLGLGVYFHMCEEDLLAIAQYPHSVIGTDGLLGRPDENGHPRAFGSFARAVEYYVFEKKLFSIEAMIRRMSGLPADRLGLYGKGLIAAGMDADLVLLDLGNLSARANYADSNRTCLGVEAVFVAGEAAYAKGALTGSRRGRLLR
ncbi:MAG: amidohydrolase family protein [Candidatus Pelethousia sp.]|nr:amidohydrolase family protein [Candidatus Pelethousia sp.]